MSPSAVPHLAMPHRAGSCCIMNQFALPNPIQYCCLEAPTHHLELPLLKQKIAESRPSPHGQSKNDAGTTVEQPVSLFADADVTDYRTRWGNIQTAIVDEPRKAVEDADSLVKSVLNKLSKSFTQERETLANQWERGDNVSTEDLRITLRRYRSFFDRLLNV